VITSISQWESQTNYNDGDLATAATLLAPPKLVKQELNELKAMVDIVYGNPVELWNSTETYSEGRIVRYNNGTDANYIALNLPNNTNQQPDIATTYWRVMSSADSPQTNSNYISKSVDYTALANDFIYCDTVPVAQVDDITIKTVTDGTDYTITLNSTPITYTSQIATAQVEDLTGIVAANSTSYSIDINGSTGSYTSSAGVAQVETVDTFTVLNLSTYEIDINGTPASYTSDSTATEAEIIAGLVAAINLIAQPVTAVDNSGNTTPNLTITADVAGTPFTATVVQGTMSLTNTTANANATISEIANGLVTNINLLSQPVTASVNANDVRLTADVAGTAFVLANPVGVTENVVTPNAGATNDNIVSGLISAVNLSSEPITATGTTSITLTADVAGTAFTDTVSNNLTQGNTVLNNIGNFTITLPLTPNANDIVSIIDNTSNFGNNALTISRNGNTIMGLAEDLTVDVTDISFRLIFNGTDWRVNNE